MPAKISAWSKAIDGNYFSDNSPEQTQALVVSIQTLVYRIEQFLETSVVYRPEPLSLELREDVKTWHSSLENIFEKWSRAPEAEPVTALKQRLETGLNRLEEQIESVVNREDGGEVGRQEGEDFFRLIGGYRGVSEAALTYAGAAQVINWSQWREERFS